MKNYHKPETFIIEVFNETLLSASIKIESDSTEWFEGDNRTNCEGSFNDQLW